jgi:hypothetical protein
MMRVYENKRYCLLQQHNNTTTQQHNNTTTQQPIKNKQQELLTSTATTNFYCNIINYQLPTTNDPTINQPPRRSAAPDDPRIELPTIPLSSRCAALREQLYKSVTENRIRALLKDAHHIEMH